MHSIEIHISHTQRRVDGDSRRLASDDLMRNDSSFPGRGRFHRQKGQKKKSSPF